ncbi:MAG: hypothetical protein AB1384_07915 [Actinomycetota bacterium]
MSNWNSVYQIAGIRIDISSSIGDPTAYLLRDMPSFAAGEPGATDLAISLRYLDETRTALPHPFPSHFGLENREGGLSFDGLQEGRTRLGFINAGYVEAELGVPHPGTTGRTGEEEAVREAVQAFLRACLQCRLTAEGGTLMHAAGIVWEDEGFVFTGHTRAGKTTLSRGFSVAAVLGDDLVAVRREGSGFTLYGTPWPGREGGTVAYGGAPLRAVFNLHPGSGEGLFRQSPAEALAELASNAPRMGYGGEESKLLEVFSSLVEAVPIYRLSIRLGDDVTPYLQRVSTREVGGDREDRP